MFWACKQLFAGVLGYLPLVHTVCVAPFLHRVRAEPEHGGVVREV